MIDEQPNNPLQGITLKTILITLLDYYNWSNLHDHISIACFESKPSIKSSLIFLRRTPWARKKVEDLYIATMGKKARID
jgi:uncharacterized protein (DUF2132 family)